MKKKTFYWLLEAVLLSWDGVSKKDLIEVYQFNPYIVEAAINVKKHIQSLEIFERGLNSNGK